MLHFCESCLGKVVVEQLLSDIFSSHHLDADDLVTYKWWAHVERVTSSILCLTSPVKGVYQNYLQFDKFPLTSPIHCKGAI